MYNYTGNLSEQDFKEFESNYERELQDYVSFYIDNMSLDDKSLDDMSLIDIITENLIDLNEKMDWLKKIGDKTAIEELESFLAEKNTTSDEVFVVQGVEADGNTDYWPEYFLGVFTTYDAATKFIEEDRVYPMYYLNKFRANGDGTMKLVCVFVWEESRNCICYVERYRPFC